MNNFEFKIKKKDIQYLNKCPLCNSKRIKKISEIKKIKNIKKIEKIKLNFKSLKKQANIVKEIRYI